MEKFQIFNSFIVDPILMLFFWLQNDHRNGLLMDHKQIGILFLKGAQIPKSCTFLGIQNLYFPSNFDAFFFLL